MKNKIIGTLLAAMICACPLSMQTRAGEDVDSLQAQIAELQAENADLKEQLDSAEFAMAYFFDVFDATLNGDINVDGVTDAVDASLILGYYSYSSTHDEPVTLREYLIGVDSATR